MTWRLIVALLVGFLIGQWTVFPEAQSPIRAFIQSSTGAVPIQGSTAGVMTVNVQ